MDATTVDTLLPSLASLSLATESTPPLLVFRRKSAEKRTLLTYPQLLQPSKSRYALYPILSRFIYT